MSAGALYSDMIRERWRRPRHRGDLHGATSTAEDVNPLCGDRVRMEVRIADGRIGEARFRGDACMVAIAAASLLTEMVRGLPVEEAKAFPQEKLIGALQTELRPSRVACALLPLQVLRGALIP